MIKIACLLALGAVVADHSLNPRPGRSASLQPLNLHPRSHFVKKGDHATAQALVQHRLSSMVGTGVSAKVYDTHANTLFDAKGPQETLEAIVNMLRGEIEEEIAAANKKYTEEKAQTQKRVDGAKTQATECSTTTTSKQGEINSAKAAIAAKDDLIAAAQADTAKAQALINSIPDDITAATAARTKDTAAYDDLRAELEAIIAILGSIRHVIKTSPLVKRVDYGAVQWSVDEELTVQGQTTITDLLEVGGHTQAKAAVTLTDLPALAARLAMVAAGVHQHKAQVTTLIALVSDLAGQVHDTDGHGVAMKTPIDDLIILIQLMEADFVTELEKLTSTEETAVATHDTWVTTQITRITELETAVAKYGDDIAKFALEIGTLDDMNDVYDEELLVLEGQCTERGESLELELAALETLVKADEAAQLEWKQEFDAIDAIAGLIKQAGGISDELKDMIQETNLDFMWRLGKWGKCSVPTCGGGEQTRTVECKSGTDKADGSGTGVVFDNGNCTAKKPEANQACNEAPCPVKCVVDEWQGFGECVGSCGVGVQTRYRSVTTDAKHGGTPCPNLQEKRTCTLTPCPVACQVGSWSGFGACSANCGAGTRTRSRKVTVKPENNGARCPTLTNTEKCNAGPCKSCCGSIMHREPQPEKVPSGWTMCYIDQNDSAYHATTCDKLFQGTPLTADQIMAAGGNYGCWHGKSTATIGAIGATNNVIQACRNNNQQTTRLNAWDAATTTLGVCIKFPPNSGC